MLYLEEFDPSLNDILSYDTDFSEEIDVNETAEEKAYRIRSQIEARMEQKRVKDELGLLFDDEMDLSELDS